MGQQHFRRASPWLYQEQWRGVCRYFPVGGFLEIKVDFFQAPIISNSKFSELFKII